MPDRLIEALRAGRLADVRAVLKSDPKAAQQPRAIVECGRLSFQKGMQLLHRHGADLNASWRGYRPLHSLIQEDAHQPAFRPTEERLACLDWLLSHGADPELPGAWPPARAIVIAAFVGSKEYVGRLRKAGGRLDGFAAAALGDVRAIEKVLRAHPEFSNGRDTGGLTALQCVAGSRLAGDVGPQIARRLLEAGADPLARTESWRHQIDAAYLAASARNDAIFELLLDRGSDPHEALTHAVWNGSDTLIQIAIAHGGDPDRAEADGQPLLNNLIRWGQMKAALGLLDRGANPNLPDRHGWTAVHQAASRGNIRVLQALLDAGGESTRRDRQGMTPCDVAKSMRRDKLINILSERIHACRSPEAL